MKIENGLSLNTDLFRAAIEIEQCGSISHAAANLFVSQPNLSAQIKTLEQTLGYKIFERSNTGVKVTEPGKLFLDSARIIVSELENIHAAGIVYKEWNFAHFTHGVANLGEIVIADIPRADIPVVYTRYI